MAGISPEFEDVAIRFFDDATEVLQEKDRFIREKFLSSNFCHTFYKDRWKSIVTWSVTEPILKFLIFTELCDRYKIRPEDHSYNDSKLLDLALHIKGEDECEYGEIGIELKWAKFDKRGRLYSHSLDKLLSDFSKLKGAKNQERYIIQFAVDKIDLRITKEVLNQQILEEVDGRSLRKQTLSALKINSFPIWTESENNKRQFILVIWKIC